MPAGYAATTDMESVFTGIFELSAELSDLRVIELDPSTNLPGRSRPPSNIVRQGNPFDLYTDINFVGTAGLPWPTVAVDVQYFFEGFGSTAGESQTALAENVYVGAPAVGGAFSHPLRVNVAPEILAELKTGVYKIAAAVQVRWEHDPGKNIIMSGFIEGAPLQITVA